MPAERCEDDGEGTGQDHRYNSRMFCMKKMVRFLAGAGAASLLLGFLVSGIEKRREKIDIRMTDETVKTYGVQGKWNVKKHQPFGIYEIYLKRPFDFTTALLALVFLFPVYLILAVLVLVKLGKPVLFTQERPGKDGNIFKLYKFRTMTDERDENGELLPDEKRLTEFGKWLRATSLDELPELFNILKGEMSLVGPRPLLVKYLPRYDARQARRHEVRPGLTGLAQVHGRNAISWEEKFEWDVKYVERVSFIGDLKIILKTMIAVIKKEGIHSDTSATMEYFTGDHSEQ